MGIDDWFPLLIWSPLSWMGTMLVFSKDLALLLVTYLVTY